MLVFVILAILVDVAALPLVSWLPPVLTPGRSMLALPLKLTPPIFLAVARIVAVAAFPLISPVTSPTKPVAVTFPVEGLYVRFPSASNPKLPLPAAPAANVITLFSLVDSLSVIVTVVEIAAVPEVF